MVRSLNPHNHGRRLLALVVALVVVAVAACGGDDDEPDPEAQPGPDVTVFVQGDFGEVPVHPDSRNVGDREEVAGTVSESFLVGDVRPEGVIDFYTDALEDWTMLGEPEAVGPDALKAEWQFADRVLTVTAAPAPTGEDVFAGQVDFVTQYSLHLHGEGE